ncbi:hypothetical protein QFZ43_008686 [Streptomyces afghaniensis]|nr:hypothetical protein [Streptomyces afghaniensis]
MAIHLYRIGRWAFRRRPESQQAFDLLDWRR